MYFPFALWIERPQTALYHRKFNFLLEWCRCVADMKNPPMGSTQYIPLVDLIDAAQMRLYHKKLLLLCSSQLSSLLTLAVVCDRCSDKY